MKDQVDALLRRRIKAAVLNSSVSRDQYLITQDDLRNGRLDLLYCAPERLNSEGFIASLKDIPGGIRLLAVDEAHCISEWGHSFRPDYLKIARFAKEAQVERVICLTATATEKVAEDIRNAFSIPSEGLFRTTMYRTNLRLLAEPNPKGTDYKAKLVAHLRKYPGPTIVYVTQQKTTEDLAKELTKKGFLARPYHAGMATPVRTKTQDDFLVSPKMIVVATIAFGMGIDKPDIRNIVHFDVPDSIESYSQQIGRAGRDGKPSVCMFYLSTKDFQIRNVFTYGARPSLHSLRLLLQDLCSPEKKKLKVGETFNVALYRQSKIVDIGAITLGIIYAQLELNFKLFRAAGTMYNDYKYVTKNPAILSNDTTPAAQAIKGAAKKATKWTQIAVDEIAKRSRIDRAELVRTLNRWDEQGAIELKKEGVENIFRLERALPSSQREIDDIIKHIDENMGATEQMNLERTQSLISLITDKTCFSRALAGYFGETAGRMQDECGHCTWCETHTQVHLPNEPAQPPDQAKVKAILDKLPVRDDPRFLAKVAFGIKSPRITELKVQNTGVFESMNVCDFPALLKVFTAACDKANM
jgi:superfamily II DNA helicase RecQ